MWYWLPLLNIATYYYSFIPLIRDSLPTLLSKLQIQVIFEPFMWKQSNSSSVYDENSEERFNKPQLIAPSSIKSCSMFILFYHCWSATTISQKWYPWHSFRSFCQCWRILWTSFWERGKCHIAHLTFICVWLICFKFTVHCTYIFQRIIYLDQVCITSSNNIIWRLWTISLILLLEVQVQQIPNLFLWVNYQILNISKIFHISRF